MCKTMLCSSINQVLSKYGRVKETMNHATGSILEKKRSGNELRFRRGMVRVKNYVDEFVRRYELSMGKNCSLLVTMDARCEWS